MPAKFQRDVADYLKKIDLGKVEDKELLEELIDTTLDTLVEEARRDFFTYIKLMAPTVLPETFINGRHIKYICYELMKLEKSVREKTLKDNRLCVSLPPGSMKTILQNLFTSWVMGRNPQWHILAVGSDTNFARDKFGRAVKRVMESHEYSLVFPGFEIRQDSNSAGRWITNKNGEYFCTGVGSNIVGRRAHLSICLKNDNVVYEKTKGYIELGDLKENMEIMGPCGYEMVSKVVTSRRKLVYNINHQVDASPEHPFLLTDGEWVEAQDLVVGNKIRTQTLWNRIKNKWRYR